MTNVTFEKLSRTAATGNPPQSGSRSAKKQYNHRAENSYLLPPDPHGLSTRALLKRGYVAQALIDSSALLFCFLFLCALGGALPLACFLMIFAKFH